MQCHSCGTDVRDGQKFCMECGASLRGVADITGEVPIVTATPVEDEPTRPIAAVPPPPPPGPAPSDDATSRLPILTGAVVATSAPPREQTVTNELRVVEATTAPVAITGPLPAAYQPPPMQDAARVPATRERRRFRLRVLLVLALFAAGATIVGVLSTVVEIDPAPDNLTPRYVVNDFGTNNSVAGLIAAGTMLAGALVWCFGYRWGAGLAGGAGAATAGWVALLIGLAEWQIATGEAGAPPASISRDIGYWSLLAAGALGVLVLLGSLARSGRDRRSGLDPWIAALGAVSFVIAAGGPLIPEGTADWSGNFNSDTLAVDLPTLFFVGRGVQLGLLALCGVVGFLLVRRYGLGLAIGSAAAAGWMLATAATEQTASPIGPGYANPGAGIDLQPHAVTIVGFALAGFFALVAVVMALLDVDR